MIPLAAIPWRLVGIGVAALVVVGALVWLGHRVRLSYQVERAEGERDAAIAEHATYKAAVERQARLDAIQREKDQARDQALTSRLTALQAESEALSRAVSRLASTVEKPDAHGVPRLAINPDWMLCAVSAPLGRDPADIAACETSARAGSVSDAERH